jgi:L-ascorbate metabolism protein UlaG (beta-lactamase superfamily)
MGPSGRHTLLVPPSAAILAFALLGCATTVPTTSTGGSVGSRESTAPDHVDITWMSIANVYYRIGGLGIVTDGYITRIPQRTFYGGGGGLAYSRERFTPDAAAVARVIAALGGPTAIDLLLTGHSHFDHSFDTATWSKLTGANILGPQTTCLQARAEALPDDRCTTVVGGERIVLSEGVTMWVVRWNHSGSSEANPEQHDPVELYEVPTRTGDVAGLRPGVAEDFPNGGGGRAFLFVVDGPEGRFSWFYQNSASAGDLDRPIVVPLPSGAGEIDYGAPLDNLERAMREAELERVDLWIGTTGQAVAELVVPILRPKAYLPIHWDGLWAPFDDGMPSRLSSSSLETYLTESGIRLLRPGQYMDRWRLDTGGITPIPNEAVKEALGFPVVQPFPP